MWKEPKEKWRPPRMGDADWASMRAFLRSMDTPIAVDLTVEGILRELPHRDVVLTDADLERITGCTDLDTLNRWRDRAFSAIEAEDLFVEGEGLEKSLR